MTQTRRHIVLGTAGHIDHGKTALVERLTGINTDRLGEEKRRGITIELGFAPWRLTDELEASIVDVPGHERLVRTMVAGAGGMDLAMMVVATDDGVMPQTREHLDVLRLLEVPAGLVVLTKCDLVEEDLLDLVEEDVRESFAGTVFDGAPLVRTSSRTGQGMDELRAAVASMASSVRARPTEGPAFLPLDRLFTKAGHGTVGTGTTLRGTLRVGDAVEAFGDTPQPIDQLRVRGLQALGAERQEAVAGMRTAVNITGRNVDALKRGMVVANAGAFAATDSVIAWVEVLEHAEPLAEETAMVHIGTSEREAVVIVLGADRLEPGQTGGLLLRFDRPTAAYAGQRLVLRRPGVHGQATIAGGEVLDPQPPRGKGAVSLAASQLEGLRGDPKERLLAIARESRSAGVTEASIVRRLPPGVGPRALKKLVVAEKLVELQGAERRWIDATLADRLMDDVLDMVGAHHDASPMSPGLAEAEVESQLPPPERHLATTITNRAVDKQKLIREGAHLAIPGRGSAVDPQSRDQMNAIVALYSEAGVTPPFDKELPKKLDLADKRVKELLSTLRRQSSLTKVADGLHYGTDVLEDIQRRVVDALRTQPEMTASDLKGVVGEISRKWAIPLFEHLDKAKVTIRSGDVRKLHPSRK